ncbi:universal stress protein [Actinomadura viridis]|uniref:Nucleotide-binding universal stress UspA family protein n=1 Tax=Actinomadura viridis TaxID=58110 RepID=A0A931GNZ7_9ACTN|nr:universal stress protein [Actinomadura viridis]MBG6086899.1 nucleotide-binding universal stress UspA family protein [Actinomadura viridis]
MNGEHGTRPPVLVGYDGSPDGERALRWAVEEARLRGTALIVCHAWHWPYPFQPPDEGTFEVIRGLGAIVADDGVRKAHALAEGLDVRWRLVQGWPTAALIKASQDAGLVVVGARGHGGFDELSVGSTAVQLPARAGRPVVVVRPEEAPARRDGGRVVVGVDGSPASEAALGFAFEEAAVRGATVQAVCGWWDPAALPGPDRVPFVQPESVRHEAIGRFERGVAPWKREHPKVPVETDFVVDRPRRALVAAAKGADLLVVGDRGIGSVREMILGPVTQAALHEAPCPVAVVPAPIAPTA